MECHDHIILSLGPATAEQQESSDRLQLPPVTKSECTFFALNAVYICIRQK